MTTKQSVSVTITKHWRPVARLVPVESEARGFCGSLKPMIASIGDVETPIDVASDYGESNLP